MAIYRLGLKRSLLNVESSLWERRRLPPAENQYPRINPPGLW